jgi:glycosyltransferase involved in cell wall biosynthesis
LFYETTIARVDIGRSDERRAMAMMAPLVSVVIPTFNNAALLGETLDGVSRQTLREFETIVVDDGSTDDTEHLIKRFYPEVVYQRQSNQGQASARNRGVALARGEYVAFCDHDDIWNARHLEKLAGCIASHPGTGMVFDNAEYFGEGVGAKLCLPAKVSRSLDSKVVGLNWLLWKYPVASMSVVMVSKACFQSLQGLSRHGGAMDDYHFYLRLAATRDIRYVDYVGCKKRVTPSSLSAIVNLKQTNVLYLEDIRKNYPEVVHKVGTISFRARLARKYFKLGRDHCRYREEARAREMFWNAYRTNPLNLRYLVRFLKMSMAERQR